MWNAWKPILVGKASPVFWDFTPFLFVSKQLKFPFWAVDYIIHGSQKIESSQKFIQIEVDMECMETNFGGQSLSDFWDFAPFLFVSKQQKFPFGP